jgi:hypothetical protein
MTNPPGGDTFSPAVLWNIIALAVPIVAAVVVATYKILKVLRDEIRAEIGPIMTRFDAMEKRFVDTVRSLWEHNSSQDIKIDAVISSHNRLRGAHDAIVQMGGHGEGDRKYASARSGGDRRAKPREGPGTPHCAEPG